MKNSLKFLLAAGLLLLGTLTAFNAALRTEYRLGEFRKPLYGYQKLPLPGGFNALDLPAAGLMDIRVEAGPCGVFVRKEDAGYVRVTQRGQRLSVALNLPRNHDFSGREVLIRCPRLNALTASSSSSTAENQPNTVPKLAYRNNRQVLVSGFNQDTMRLVLNHTAHLVLARNRLAHLQATVGNTPGSTAQLDLLPSNQLAISELRIKENGKLVARNVRLPTRRWHFGDSARLELTGAALGGW